MVNNSVINGIGRISYFSSDNGPVYDDGYEDGTTVKKSNKEVDRGHDGSGIYRGGKYQIYEGGTRVPFKRQEPYLPPAKCFLVQCIDTDPKKVAKARQYIQSKGWYGQISVNQFDGKTLPYTDNLNEYKKGNVDEEPRPKEID